MEDTTLQRATQLRAEGLNYTEIASALAAEGHRSVKTRRAFSPLSVRYALHMASLKGGGPKKQAGLKVVK